MPRSSRTAGADHHRRLRYTPGDNDRENHVAIGHQAHSTVHPHIVETEIRHLSHDLALAFSQIEVLEGELGLADQEIRLLREENAMLRENNATLKDCLDGRDDAEREVITEMGLRLEHLHEELQGLDAILQAVMDAVGVTDDNESSGIYFEGDWEDMASLWREGHNEGIANHARSDRAPVGQHRAEIRLPHESMTETNASGSSRHFERSNAPSPEGRRSQQTCPDTLRQIETEMAILRLQDRMERTETGMRALTSRCDAQDQWHDLLVEMLHEQEIILADILSTIYEAQEEYYDDYDDDDDDDDDDEPYCTCGERGDDLDGEDMSATLRGGMGGRDEDEEFVYDYGGYTNWDQMDASSQQEGMDGSQSSGRDKEIIRELRQQVELLKEQVRALMETAHRDSVSRSRDRQEEKEDEPSMRGGSGEEEVHQDGSRNHADTSSFPTLTRASPHLLCQRAATRVGDSTIHYILVYLPPGFVIHGTNKPELVFHSAATIYYFPTGETEDFVKREAWRQKACGSGHWQEVAIHKIQSKQVFKSAIASWWETMGLSWNVLTGGDWNFDGDEGDMYMVNDNNLFLTNRTREVAGAQIRGGSGYETDPSFQNESAANDSSSVFEQLMQEAAALCVGPPISQRGDFWMTLANVLQTRNCFLERELENFKELNHSLIQDLHWQMDVQVEMEERVEAALVEKNAIAEDLEVLKARLMHLIESDTSRTVRADDKEDGVLIDEIPVESPGLGTMRGGNEDPSSPVTSTKNTTLPAFPSDPSPACATIKAKSFDFHPKESIINFAGASPHLYQFPHRSTLPEICRILEIDDGEESLTNDPYIARVLEIMKIREEMGIELPENVSDERITISICDVPSDCHLDRETKIAAWKVNEEDVDVLGKLLTKLDIDLKTSKSSTNTSVRTASSEEEQDYYEDIGDLINSLNDAVKDDFETSSPKFCTCQIHPVNDSESFSETKEVKQHCLLSVRGGGSDSEYWNHDAHGNREFPLQNPKLPAAPGVPPITPKSYGTLAPNTPSLSSNEAIITVKSPLSIRLGRLMFPAKFFQRHEDSISLFDWQRTKRMNPQFRDKRSRSYKYTRGAQCEVWAMQLDEHREHCDYCQAMFIEEDYARSNATSKYQDDASKPPILARRSSENTIWPGICNETTLRTGDHPDSGLRGGAGHERDLEHEGEENEDWQSEWEDLAGQTQSSGYQPRTFRNSSTLSTKTTTSPPSPVDRNFRKDCWPQSWDVCTAEEFLRTEHRKVDRREVRAGEFSKPPYNTRRKSPDSLTPSKTSNPFLLEMRRSRHDPILERPLTNCDSLSIKDSDSVLELKAEAWLDNPRPAPAIPFQRSSAALRDDTVDSHHADSIGTGASTSGPQTNSVSKELSFRSDRHEFFPAGEYHTISENASSMTTRTRRRDVPLPEVLSDEAYEEHVRSGPVETPNHRVARPKLGERLCKKCAELLNLLAEYIAKWSQRLAARTSQTRTYAPKGSCRKTSVPSLKPKTKLKKSTSKLAFRTPAAPAPSRTGWEAWYMNRRLPYLPSDKSLPATPRASMSTLTRTSESKGKFPATPRASFSRIDCARIIAQAQDSAHANFVSQGADQWHVPTVAGPSDLVKEALMWLDYEDKSGKIGKTVFDGNMADETEYDYSRNAKLAVV
ncbi:uncharacterized protein J4E87_009015 [Alternaria ethzedia]|uniref:uncharacterized protein n=1 Tax=Alternaria ethzedia TaxID=181014 RepID=UPI0020C5AE4F|nr:uncharacterized protein J4E87_009015 [Alternaria ethzedia]KAI4615557.1 hypothetical protein J4E87_009015 [Alternaria ethzedia]